MAVVVALVAAVGSLAAPPLSADGEPAAKVSDEPTRAVKCGGAVSASSLPAVW